VDPFFAGQGIAECSDQTERNANDQDRAGTSARTDSQGLRTRVQPTVKMGTLGRITDHLSD